MAEPSEDVRPLIAGRYRLQERIGEGGMAQVWRADDVRLARPVAIKLLTLLGEGETEEERVHRFLREARIAAAVRHPNVVDVLDFGTSEDGRSFMAMELLEGESLEARLARTPPITLAELIDVALGALDGLDAVHRAGVVHRDLKPDNVFLLDDDGEVRPKLLDFGVSRALDRGTGRRSVLTTMQGRLVGTPEYMSPEQARGHSDVDWRTDIYSVGVILYEAITGRLPYESSALGDLIISIAMGGAPSVVQVRPDIGVAISDVIERAMQVSREDRWQSAQEMRRALSEAAVACLGRDVRGSLPAPALARHEARDDASPLIPSGVITQRGALGFPRPANGTPQAFSADAVAVDAVPSVAPPRRSAPWKPIAAAALVAIAGVGSWALVRGGSEDAAPIAASQDRDTERGAVDRATSSAPDGDAPGLSASDPEPGERPVGSTTSGAARADRPETASAVGAASPPSRPGRSSVAEGASSAPSSVDSAPRPVQVVLRGVPRGAHVAVDGEPAVLDGGALRLPRDGQAHRIVVRSGAARWRVRHVADEDGAYRVQLRAARRRGRSRAEGADREPASPTLFRELDY